MIEHLIPPYLALCSRWHGSAIPTPKVLEGAMYALPYVVISGYYMAQNGWNWVEYGTLAACLIATTAAKNTGHDDGFKNHSDDDKITKIAVPLSSFFRIKRDSQAYDALFFSLKGLAIAAFTAIIAAYYADYVTAAALLLSGTIGYPLAYSIGNKLHLKIESPVILKKFLCSNVEIVNRKFRIAGTTWGELLSGFFAGLGFLVC